MWHVDDTGGVGVWRHARRWRWMLLSSCRTAMTNAAMEGVPWGREDGSQVTEGCSWSSGSREASRSFYWPDARSGSRVPSVAPTSVVWRAVHCTSSEGEMRAAWTWRMDTWTGGILLLLKLCWCDGRWRYLFFTCYPNGKAETKVRRAARLATYHENPCCSWSLKIMTFWDVVESSLNKRNENFGADESLAPWLSVYPSWQSASRYRQESLRMRSFKSFKL